MKDKLSNFLSELIPLIIALILVVFFNKEIVLILIGVCLIVYTFLHKYQKGEVYLFLLGLFFGLVLELIGNFYLGQKWAEASFFTVPIWLPIFWGYGFVVIRRIGEIFVEK